MRSGELDRRIQLQRLGAGRNSFNEPATEFEPFATVWAKVTPISDGERARARQTSATATHRFLIRYSGQVAGITAKDRVFYNGQAFDISGVKEVNRREGLEITATARADI